VDVRLYQFAPPNKNSPVVVLTRDSAIAYLSTVIVAPITSTIRGVPSEVVARRGRHESTMCSERTQCSYHFLESARAAACPAEFFANAGKLRGSAFLSRM